MRLKHTALLVVLLSCAVSIWSARRRKVIETPTNNILFEKVEYRVLNRSVISHDWLEIKPLAPNVVRLNASMCVTKEAKEVWGRGVMYYKYNTYEKFLIDYKYEGCSFINHFLNDSQSNPFYGVIMENVYEFFFDSEYETNFQFKCPIPPGVIYGVSVVFVTDLTKSGRKIILRGKNMYLQWYDKLNFSRFSIPLLPAGRFRVNLYAYATQHEAPFATAEFYFRISDLRIWL